MLEITATVYQMTHQRISPSDILVWVTTLNGQDPVGEEYLHEITLQEAINAPVIFIQISQDTNADYLATELNAVNEYTGEKIQPRLFAKAQIRAVPESYTYARVTLPDGHPAK